MEVSRPPEYARTTFLMFSFFMMIAPFKNTLLFPDASIPLAPSCICVSVDAFIIRSAVFSSITKPYKPFLLPAPDFRSCCIFMRYLKNIFIFYAFAQYIFGPVCIPYSWAAPAFRQGAQWSIHVVWVAFHTPPHTNFCSACYTGCKLKYAWCLHCGGDSASSKSKGDVIIMKKRLISFLLAVSMMLSLVPAGAVAAEVQNLVSARKPSTARRLPAGVWNRA